MANWSEQEFNARKRAGTIKIKGEEVQAAPKKKAKARKIAKSPGLEPPMVAGQIHEGAITRLEVLLPIRTESELNRRDHWRAAASRKHLQREEVGLEWRRLCGAVKFSLPCVVKLTRIGAHLLDDDNLASAFKAIRDQIASILGVDDGSDMVRWQYDQVADHRYGYGVKIEILRPFQA